MDRPQTVGRHRAVDDQRRQIDYLRERRAGDGGIAGVDVEACDRPGDRRPKREPVDGSPGGGKIGGGDGRVAVVPELVAGDGPDFLSRRGERLGRFGSRLGPGDRRVCGAGVQTDQRLAGDHRSAFGTVDRGHDGGGRRRDINNPRRVARLGGGRFDRPLHRRVRPQRLGRHLPDPDGHHRLGLQVVVVGQHRAAHGAVIPNQD